MLLIGEKVKWVALFSAGLDRNDINNKMIIVYIYLCQETYPCLDMRDPSASFKKGRKVIRSRFRNIFLMVNTPNSGHCFEEGDLVLICDL